MKLSLTPALFVLCLLPSAVVARGFELADTFAYVTEKDINGITYYEFTGIVFGISFATSGYQSFEFGAIDETSGDPLSVDFITYEDASGDFLLVEEEVANGNILIAYPSEFSPIVEPGFYGEISFTWVLDPPDSPASKPVVLSVTGHTGAGTTETILIPIGGVEALDHYQCYKVKSNAKLKKLPISLIDQFGASTAQVKKTELLCNPVSKNGEPILNPSGHLVCYKIDAEFEEVTVLTKDQLAEQELRVKKPEMLCVPASKEVLPEN